MAEQGLPAFMKTEQIFEQIYFNLHPFLSYKCKAGMNKNIFLLIKNYKDFTESEK